MALLFTVIGLSVLILVHELGHFLAAKFFKVRVDEFGFGFPPRLFSWTRGETRYSVNALPFGGFVKIYGGDGETRTRSKTTNVSESTNNNIRIVEKELSYRLGGIFFDIQRELGRFGREKQYADALERALKDAGIPYRRELSISVEGQLSNTVDFLVDGRVLVELKSKPFILKSDYFQVRRYLEAMRMELGLIVNFRDRYLKPKRVLNPSIRMVSEHSDEFVALDRDKQKHVLNPSIRMVSEHSDVLVVSDRDRSFATQPVWKRLVITVAGVAANLAAAWLALSLVFMVGAPPHLLISGVAPSSPAAEAGLVGGDIVAAVAAGGRMLYDPVKADEFVAMVSDAAREGSTISLTVGAGKEAREVLLVPRVNPPEGEGRLGVGLAEIGVPQAAFFESFRSGAEETWALTKLITAGMVQFFGGVFQKPEVLKEVAGPVGVVAAAAQAGSLGFAYLLHFLGLISVNLVVLNIIPFPALDGGRALFLLIEKLKGSPLPVRFERAVNVAGFVFLLLLMVLVTVQDVGRL